MISYEEALAIILNEAERLPIIELPIEAAIGSVSAEVVTSPMQTPSSDNSAMDGFALKADESKAASLDNSVQFSVTGSLAAGDKVGSGGHEGGSACEIMTGAPIPKGYDAVVRVEDVTVLDRNGDRPARIEIKSPVSIGENVRRAGEDFQIGDQIVGEGVIVRERHVMGAASVGIDNLKVYCTPTVSLLCTGKELIEGAAVRTHSGEIYNSNAPYLRTRMESLGLCVDYRGTLSEDEANHFIETIKSITQELGPPDLIISTGAVSAGAWDFIPAALEEELGAKILFHKVMIRPGKPILFARLPNGSYYFGLPGNPIAVAAGFRFFVLPLLRALQGLKNEKPHYAALKNETKKKAGMRLFYKAFTEIDSNGHLLAEILPGQESFKIAPLIAANGWAVLEEERTEYQPGDIVKFYPFMGD